MKRSQDIAMVALIVLVGVVVVFIATQGDRATTAGAIGFLFMTLGWVGMYFLLKRELPDHPLAKVSYVRVDVMPGGRARRSRALLDLVATHWTRHGMDLWMGLLVSGLVMIIAAVLWKWLG